MGDPQSSLQLSLPDAQATLRFGQGLGQVLSAGNVVLLAGDLGSGKTTLVQGLGAALGITEPIVSPTFALIHEYPEANPPLYHLDLYRLDPAEVAALQPETYWQGLDFPLGITVIEWPERLPYRPETYLQIQLIHAERGRQAIVTAVGDPDLAALAARLAQALA
jgi:tRNA threonylcarbamoyladenosine biosynthesis protein TsaE